MALFLYQYRFQLKSLFIEYDENNTFYINKDDLLSILKTINVFSNNLINDEQINIIIECLINDGKYNYNDFDSKFKIIDNINII